MLDLYALPYNPEEPVVCVDEKSKQLLGSPRPKIRLKPGQTTKVDDEYERLGTRNLFVAVEPLVGWRQMQMTLQRKTTDFVEFIRQLMHGRYRRAKRVHLVLDNLNTHFAKGFIEVLGGAKDLNEVRLDLCVHGSQAGGDKLPPKCLILLQNLKTTSTFTPLDYTPRQTYTC